MKATAPAKEDLLTADCARQAMERECLVTTSVDSIASTPLGIASLVGFPDKLAQSIRPARTDTAFRGTKERTVLYKSTAC